jgi:hypothetical protein
MYVTAGRTLDVGVEAAIAPTIKPAEDAAVVKSRLTQDLPRFDAATRDNMSCRRIHYGHDDV